MRVQISSYDPALANWGMAKLELDLDTYEFTILDLQLISTERMVTKQVRQNSDDMRRAKEITDEFRKFAATTTIGFTEVPSGAQSARAAYSFGAAVGILAGSPIPLIQVQPFETKLAAVGTKTASKEEMIEWATEKYPNAPWLTTKRKGSIVFTNANEHLADAVAVAHAGVKTDQFKQLVAIWKSEEQRNHSLEVNRFRL